MGGNPFESDSQRHQFVLADSCTWRFIGSYSHRARGTALAPFQHLHFASALRAVVLFRGLHDEEGPPRRARVSSFPADVLTSTRMRNLQPTSVCPTAGTTTNRELRVVDLIEVR